MTRLGVALVTEVFFDDPDGARLREHLEEAKRSGADVALLPELPLNEWSPYSKVARDEDAEQVDGPRQRRMAEAAARVGVAVVGGAIVVESETGRRHNTAVVYAADGTCLARYRKVHLPEEEGYWETSHYEPGARVPETFDGLGLRAGLQICSDVNRPEGFQLLAAQGAEVVFAPRATPPETYDRWRTVLRADAVTSGTYVVSANRPRPEHGASIGGPSLAIDPNGEVLLETTDPVRVVVLERSVVADAAREYPGYLKRFPELYADGWRRLGG
jgi:predicted amidohydrolase